MFGWIKYKKENEHGEIKPTGLRIHKKDGSVIEMAWDSSTLKRAVRQYVDICVTNIKFLISKKEQEFDIKQILSDLDDIELITKSGNADFVQVIIVKWTEQVYLIKTDRNRLTYKWLESGKIRFSERYYAAVSMNATGKYQCKLYDSHVSDEEPVLITAYDEIPTIFELQYENKAFRLLIMENNP